MTSKEEDIAGMGCILHFFSDMFTCMDAVNNYIIGLDECELKNPKPLENVKDKSPEPKTQVKDDIQAYIQQLRIDVRFQILRCHAQLNGISQIVKGFDMEKLNDLKKKIRESTTPDRNNCEDYISILYAGFVKSVLKDMLRDIQAYEGLKKDL